MSNTRRIYFYLVAFVALTVLTVGIGLLFSLLFDVVLHDTTLVQVGRQSFDKGQFSLGLAMIVIAGPLWFFFWQSIQKRVTGNPEEIGAVIRKLFLNLVLLSIAFSGLTAASTFLRWLLGGAHVASTPSGSLATFIVSAGVWYYHWWVSEKEGYPLANAITLRRWYVYVLSAFGLVWLSVGIVNLIRAAVLSLPFWVDTLVSGQFWSNTTQMSITWIVLGGAAWYFHWFRMALGDVESVLRQVYFYVLAISGGAITALVALTTTFYEVFRWIFNAVSGSASLHFQFLGWSIPALLVGIAIWGYHYHLMQEEQIQVVERRTSAQRVHLYLMSFIGLGTLVSGLIILFGILLRLLINSLSTSVAGGYGGWRSLLSVCLSLLIIGAPLWSYYWNKVLKLSETGGVIEWRVLSRRIFLYVVVVVSIGILLADLVNIVYQVLNGILQGRFGIQVLRNITWSLQTLIVAVPLLWYHWRIIRTDQRRGAEEVAVHKKVTFITSDRTGEMTSQLVEKLGYKIQVRYITGPASETISPVSNEELTQIISSIQNAPSKNVLLITVGSKIVVIPYTEK